LPQVYTAGTSGFLQILPIYLDHILFPTLRREDFMTEVHHVSGRGRCVLWIVGPI
jgi:Zn-dependent M16 (insulinase) family peptidase